MGVGRKRKPDHIKLVEGTARPDRMNPEAPDPSAESPRPIGLLSRLAVEHFGALRARLEEIGMASATDTEMLATAALRLAEIEECTRIIEEEGMFRGERRHPAMIQRGEAMKHLQSLLSEFGLSPASRGKVSAAKKKPGSENPYAKLG